MLSWKIKCFYAFIFLFFQFISFSDNPDKINILMAGGFEASSYTAISTATGASQQCKLIGPNRFLASTEQSGNPAKHAVDGINKTRWAAYGKGSSITMWYPKHFTSCQMFFKWFSGGLKGRTYPFKVYGSTDGRNFTKLLYQGRSLPNENYQTVSLKRENIIAVKVVVDGNSNNNWVSLYEVGIKADKAKMDVPYNKNCALAKPSSFYGAPEQSSNPVRHALDGNVNTRWAGKSRNANIVFNYSYPISPCQISLKWYKGGVDGRIYPFNVYGSTDGKNFNIKLFEGKSSPNTNYQYFNLQKSDVRSIKITVKGNSNNEWAGLYEMKIYAHKKPKGRFKHPGILVDQAKINEVKALIHQGGHRKTEFIKAMKNVFKESNPNTNYMNPSNIIYTHSATGAVSCKTSPKRCEKIRDDGLAAYTAALGWVYTGNKAYARTAIAILDAYAEKNVRILEGHNQQLQSAWMAEMFPKAAELIRHTNAGWPEAKAKKFGTWMNNSLQGLIRDGWFDPGNWTASMINGAMNIAVYNDDVKLYENSLKVWRNTLPSAFYLKSDGSHPKPFGRIHNGIVKTKYPIKPGKLTKGVVNWLSAWGTREFKFNGMNNELCRDTGHVFMSIAAFSQAAETARIHGDDLYTNQDTLNRLFHGYELTARLTNKYANPNEYRKGILSKRLRGEESQMCYSDSINVEFVPTLEIAYAYLHGKLDMDMPNTKAYLEKTRHYGNKYHDDTGVVKFRGNHVNSAWGYLTHGLTSL